MTVKNAERQARQLERRLLQAGAGRQAVTELAAVDPRSGGKLEHGAGPRPRGALGQVGRGPRPAS